MIVLCNSLPRSLKSYTASIVFFLFLELIIINNIIIGLSPCGNRMGGSVYLPRRGYPARAIYTDIWNPFSNWQKDRSPGNN
jgi:hypothetical protein